MLNRHLSVWADHSREVYLTNEEMEKSKGGYWNVQEIVELFVRTGRNIYAETITSDIWVMISGGGWRPLTILISSSYRKGETTKLPTPKQHARLLQLMFMVFCAPKLTLLRLLPT